ncbi:MAG: gfo/Idh/MocA family oxidoreductase [Spirochaetaceae bacterium]|nr:MAG: gfo/Idh/MocA family oxidoreductase [Spirochaetaceae bacterium]
MAVSLAECDEMIAACEKSGTLLAVNHSRRWDPTFRAAKDLIESGRIGKFLTMISHCEGIKPYPAWRSDEEGPLLHDATHTFDLFRIYAGDAAWVVGTAVRRLQPFPLEDESMSIVTFRNGVTGVAIVNELTEFAQFDLELIGTHGKIVIGMGEKNLWGVKKLVTRDAHVDPNIEWHALDPQPFPNVSARTPMEEAADDVVRCLDEGGSPLSTGEDGRAAIEIIMGVYESERRGNARVEFPLPGGPSTLYEMRREGFFA